MSIVYRQRRNVNDYDALRSRHVQRFRKNRFTHREVGGSLISLKIADAEQLHVLTSAANRIKVQTACFKISRER